MLLRSSWCALMFAGVATIAVADDAMAADARVKTTFTVRIENVSTPTTLRSATGETAPAPNSPGLWVVHTGKQVVFASGKLDRGAGLESQAEEGNPSRLAASVKRSKGVVASGVFNTPVGDHEPGAALPGKAYEFEFTSVPGQRLTVATMFAQSNDLFYAPDDAGIALFENGQPIRGDITRRLRLWDVGTEVNEEPGFGGSQAPRQSAPNTGIAEHRPVRPIEDVNDGYTYPPVDQVIRVTISPKSGAISSN